MTCAAPRTVLIFGASSGIGRATALAFAREGARVVLAARRENELRDLAAAIARDGGEAAPCVCDVTRVEDIERTVTFAIERFGDLHAAFNNAGIEGRFAPIVDCTPADFDATITVNLRGVWLALKYEMAAFARLGHGGAIVNTSSWLAHGAFAGSSIYSASKAALDGLVRAVALEGAPLGVRVNNVNPGYIDTPMFRRFAGDEAAIAPFRHHVPAARLGRPEDIAGAVTWLCSDAAAYITGQTLTIDGGLAVPGQRVA